MEKQNVNHGSHSNVGTFFCFRKNNSILWIDSTARIC